MDHQTGMGVKWFLIISTTIICCHSSPLDNIIKGNNQFSWDLLQNLLTNNPTPDGNVFCSPLSVSTALAMVEVGANGDTLKQLQDTMHYPTDQCDLLAGYKSLVEQYKNPSDKITLNLADNIFIDKSFTSGLKSNFTTAVTDNFAVQLQDVDFQNGAGTAADTINKWVEDQTNKKITNLVDSDTVQGMLFVIVNAIYFKAKWSLTFPKGTGTQDFTTPSNKIVKADFMDNLGQYPYANMADLNAQMISLLCEDVNYEVLFILPNDGVEMSKLIGDISSKYNSDFASFRNQLAGNSLVHLQLPKFTLKNKNDLKEPLKSLGIVDMFDGTKADFSGINGKKDLYVSFVIQDAFVSVNEEGIEAAAATAVGGEGSGMPVNPVQLTFNKPFIVIICDKQRSNVLFNGVVNDPTATT